MQICMYGYAGESGARKLARNNLEKLSSRFSQSFINEYLLAKRVDEFSDIVCMTKGETYIPDEVADSEVRVTLKDGVYKALWQLGETLASGLEVNQFDIPVLQETIEICELLDVSPYEMETDGYLYVMPDGETPIVGKLIGKTRYDNDRVVYMREVTRYLNKN